MVRAAMLAGVMTAALAGAAAQAASAPNTALPVGTVIRTPLTGVTVFGDSLSDDGNIAIASKLPNLTGTSSFQKFTTNPGNVTVENIASRFGLPLAPSLIGGEDFAFGGSGVLTNSPGTAAGVPTVTTQVTGYLSAHSTLDPERLYTVWAGANDIFYHGAAALAGAGAAQAIAKLPANLPPATLAALTAQINAAAAAQVGVAAVESAAQAAANVGAAAQQEVALLNQLHAAGARHVVVFNLPDIGATPSAQSTDKAAPGAAAAFTALTGVYNQALSSGLASIRTGIVPVNAALLSAEAAADPAAFGLVNATTPACTTASSLTCTQSTLVAPNAALTYLFADGVHPTTQADRVLSSAVVSELRAPAYVSLLAEAPLAFSDAQRSRLQDELAMDGVDPGTRTRAFASFDHQSQRFDRGAYTGRVDDDGGSITAGVDARLTPSLTAGAVVTFGDSSSNFAQDVFKFRTQEVLGQVFGQYLHHGAGYLNGSAGVGGVDFRNVKRQVLLGGVDRRVERADTGGAVVQADLRAGWWFGFDVLGQALKASPYASVRYERVLVDRYAEDGFDSTAMTFAQQTREALVGEFGLRAEATVRTPFAVLSPFVQLAYDHDGDARARYVTAGLVTLPGRFDMPGYAPTRTWGSVEAGVNARVTDRVGVFAAYRGRFSDDRQRYDAADVGVKLAF